MRKREKLAWRLWWEYVLHVTHVRGRLIVHPLPYGTIRYDTLVTDRLLPQCESHGGGGGGLLAFVRDSAPRVEVGRRAPKQGGGSLGGGGGRLAAEEGFSGDWLVAKGQKGGGCLGERVSRGGLRGYSTTTETSSLV